MTKPQPHVQQYIDYIQRSINSITPYEDNEQLKRLYHLGFMSSMLADIMLDDSKYYHKFKARIEAADERNKEL